MKNNFDELFDENAKNLFQNFEMDFNPQDWSKMERHLNKSDEKFDANARQKLENYEMPYNKQDWAKMETLLDKDRHRAGYFWFYKTLEFSFVSLFLLGSFLFFGEKSQPQPDNNLAFNNSNGKNTNSNPANDNSNGKNTNSNPANDNSNGKTNNSNAANSNSNGKTNNSNAANSNFNGKNTNSNAANSNFNGKNTNSNAANNNSNGKTNNSNAANNNSNGKNTNSNPANGNSNALEGNFDPTNITTAATLTNNELLLLKNAVLTDKIQVKNGDGDEQTTAADLKKVKLALPFVRQMRLAAVAGMETHSENSFGRGTASFLGGASLETDINRHFALSFGLHYARRNHELELNSQKTSTEGLVYNLKELRNTHLSMLQIPIALQTNVFRNEKWRVYLTSGLNASLIFDKTYSGTLQVNVPQSAGNARMQTNISPREYEGGLFQTGNFIQNAFLTAQIGAGAERQLTDHFSLFIQPTYQISFTRFGQNRQDKTRVISLNVGVKTNF